MNRLVQRILPRSAFAQSVAVLVTGTVGGQAVIVLSSPLLTRVYTPDQVGVFAAFSSVLAILGSFATLRYELAIPLPEVDADAGAVAVVSVLSAVLTGLLTWGGCWLLGGPLTRALNVPQLQPYLWLLPIAVALTGMYQTGYYLATRFSDFGTIARTRWTQSLAMVAVQLGGHGAGTPALLVGRVVGQSGGILVLWRRAFQRLADSFRRPQVSRLKWAARRYSKFPMLSVLSSTLNAVGMQLPPLLFSALFGPWAAGVYTITHRVLVMPMRLLGQAVSDAFFAKAVQAHRTGGLGAFVTGVHTFLAQVSMPISLLLVVAAPELFALIFGNQWRQAGEFARWMAPWIYLVSVTSPLTSLFHVMEKQAQHVAFEAVLLATRVVTLMVGGVVRDLTVTVALFSVGSAVCWLGLLVWILRNARCEIALVWHGHMRAASWASLAVLPLALGYLASDSRNLWYVGLVGTLLAMGIRYFALVRRVVMGP